MSGLCRDLKVFVQADCTVYLNALYAAMCKTPAGRAFLDYLFGAQIVTKVRTTDAHWVRLST